MADPQSVKKRWRWPRGATVGCVIVALLFAYLVSQGLLIAWKPLCVRAATPTDPVREKYFGIDPDDGVQFHNIAVIEGAFSHSTWIEAGLHIVESGKIRPLNGFVVGRSPNQIGAPIWTEMKITLALGTADTPEGKRVQLGSAGHSRGGGNGYDFLHNVKVTHRKTAEPVG